MAHEPFAISTSNPTAFTAFWFAYDLVSFSRFLSFVDCGMALPALSVCVQFLQTYLSMLARSSESSFSQDSWYQSQHSSQKTMGLAQPLRVALAPLAPRIRAAFVYGSVAKRQDTASSDVDLLLISEDVSYPELFTTLEELSQQLGRTVNPTIYTPKEWAQRIERGDAFASRVLAQPKIWLIGDDRAVAV